MTVLDDIKVEISVMLGSTTMPVHQLLRMGRGAVIELDTTEEDEVLILANDLPVARGAIVVIGNRIAVEVKHILPRSPHHRH
jgi:flagellar motor switch protein FliN/FliY